MYKKLIKLENLQKQITTIPTISKKFEDLLHQKVTRPTGMKKLEDLVE